MYGLDRLYNLLVFVKVTSDIADVQLYTHADCLVGDTVLAIFETLSRGHCTLYCMEQSGAGFSYDSRTQECKIFKVMFKDQSKCGVSSNIYGKVDGCGSTPFLKDYRGNYTIEHPFMNDNSLARYRCTSFNDPKPVDNCPVSRCEEFWTPASLSCSDKECYDPTSLLYNGSVVCTSTGITCQRWDSDTPHTNNLYQGWSDRGNRCMSRGVYRPWCYTVDPSVRWDYCPVDACV